MKKILSIVLSVAMVLSLFMLPGAVSADSAKTAEFDSWDGTATVVPKGRAIRTKQLSDGTFGCVYYKSGDGIYFAKGKDGIRFTGDVKIAENATDEEHGYGRLEAQNPNFIEMPNGDIMVFYRYNTFTGDPTGKPWSTYYSSIRYQISTDGGATFGDYTVMVSSTNTKTLPDSDGAAGYGFWEPDPVLINGTLICYYADTVTPNDLRYQNIAGCVWNGSSFGEPFIAQNGKSHGKYGSRDGMSVVTKLADGTYAMVFEATSTGSAKWNFVIEMSLSDDGINWTDPVAIAQPQVEITEPTPFEPNPEYAVCANPYVITLPDGRLAVSFQTTDRYNGLVPSRVTQRVGVQVMVSNDVITKDSDIGTDSFTRIANPDTLNENEFSKTASLLCADGYLYVYYMNGVNNSQDSYTLGSIDVSYMKLEDEKIDGNNINDYTITSTGKNPVTADENGFTIGNGCTNMVYSEVKQEIGEIRTPVPVSFDEDNVVKHGGSGYAIDVDAENRTVTSNNKQTKTMFKDTAGLSEFEASVTVKGNAAGAFYGGMSFHVQPDTFTSGTFASDCYNIFIKRTAADGLGNIKVYVRYGTSNKQDTSTTFSNAVSDDVNLQLKLTVKVTAADFYAEVYDGDKLIGTTPTYPLDAKGINYTSGAIALFTNGVHTFSDLEVKRVETALRDTLVFKESANIEMGADFTLPVISSGIIQTGYNFRTEQTAAFAPGLTGYAVKIIEDSKYSNGTVKLLLTRYGTNSEGTQNANLGDIKSYTDTTVLGGANAGGQTLNMKAVIEGEQLTVTLTNKADPTLTSTYTFDLTADSTASKVTYNTYYACGGFGIFKNGNFDVTVSNIEYKELDINYNNMDTSLYTVYQPGNALTAVDNSFVSSDNATKKIMLNDTVVSDFDATATFKIGADGELKSGIVFRAQNVGNNVDDLEGYSCVVHKTPNNTSNYGRLALIVYKWGLDANGKQTYLGIVASKADTAKFNTVYPGVTDSMLAAIGAVIRLNVSVTGNMVTVSYDIIDKNGNVGAGDSLTTALDAKTFEKEADATIYNAGSIGVSTSLHTTVCDFNITNDRTGTELSDISEYTTYTSNSAAGYEFKVDADNNTLYSTTGGFKQAVLENIGADTFNASANFRSFSATTFNMAFDFGVDTASPISGDLSSKIYSKYACYRVQFTKTSSSDSVDLRLFKIEATSTGNKRTELKLVNDSTFFSDYTAYHPINVNISVSLNNGRLTAVAYIPEHPEKTISYEVDGIEADGAFGWYVANGGYMSQLSIKAPIDDALVSTSACENGKVHTVVNSGAANAGDTVKIIPVADNGYTVDKVYYSVDGTATEVIAADGEYKFSKPQGATLVYATYKEEIKVGDLDGDGVINATDAVIMRKMLLGAIETDMAFADVDADGQLTILDIIRLKKYLASPDTVVLGKQ